MTLILIELALILAAIYSGGMYVFVYAKALRKGGEMLWEEYVHVERNTFHLGLCFILAVGFLGLLVK